MRHVYPIVTTPALAECRAFYERALEARVLFESRWYLHLCTASAQGRFEIGFLHPEPPQRLPLFRHATLSRGLCLALEVDDVLATHRQMVARGVEIFSRLQVWENGERSFSLIDPAGVVLNVVEHHRDASVSEPV
ncbi:MAG TPA: VOC family protein [Nevskiaceae bacterium]|nr:VOC family protein [Nevskiaceae bacterium]